MVKYIKKVLTALVFFGISFNAMSNQGLTQFLDKNDYNNFYLGVEKDYKSDKEKLDYLLTLTNKGHPIVYWYIADIYSKNMIKSKYVIDDQNKIDAVRFYFYVGYILLRQDTEICHDKGIKSILLNSYQKQFPYTMDFERVFFKNTGQAFVKSVEFVNKLPSRPAYNWACTALDNSLIKTPGDYGKQNVWNARRDVILALKNNFNQAKK